MAVTLSRTPNSPILIQVLRVPKSTEKNETLGKHALGPLFYLRLARGQHGYSESVADFFWISYIVISLHLCDLHTPCIESKLCLMDVFPGVGRSDDIRVRKGKVLRQR